MDELENKIFNCLLENGEYRFSSDMTLKAEEHTAIKNLEDQGLIKIKLRTIGYILADAL